MLQITAREIAALTDGALVGGATGDELVTGTAQIDSREVGPGDLFAAFLGESVDGHDFLAAAQTSGAAITLVTEDRGVPAVQVDDVQRALSVLAREQLGRARRENAELVVLAITGSAGKTGTKDLLGTILGAHGPTVAPAGSFNNELGLPLTVLRISAETRYLVLEMGARGIGHIAALTTIARPDISLVLNVGSAHIGEFGSIDAIAQAKGELVEALAPGGARHPPRRGPARRRHGTALTRPGHLLGLHRRRRPRCGSHPRRAGTRPLRPGRPRGPDHAAR